MATARFTLGAVLSAASETASTITNTMNAVNTAVGMANTFVSRAADNQKMRYQMEAVGNKQAIAIEIAMEMQTRQDAVNAYLNGDKEKEAEFEANLKELLDAVKS